VRSQKKLANPTTKIRPMSQSEFEVWLPHCVKEYANDKARTMQISIDQALKLSEQSFAEGLPEGLDTANNFLFTILTDNDDIVGTIWFNISTTWDITSAFIYDLEIAPAHRRKGHAQNALRLIEHEAKKHGATKLALHVFAFNHGATELYKKLGYQTTDISMAKPL